MMRSLTARLSLLFMLAVMGVLTLAGLLFYQLSAHHFRLLDRQALLDKVEATQALFRQDAGRVPGVTAQLNALLSAHHDLGAQLVGPDGEVLFAAPAPLTLPDVARHAPDRELWQWRHEGAHYRGMRARITPPDGPPLTLYLMLDATRHLAFFDTLRWWFWIALGGSALLGAGLGWAVARSGLRPVRQVTAAATAVSARSLKSRIPLAPVPLELQQLVQAFNAMLERLDEAFMRLSNFSADIAHELRTPVASLMTHTEVTLSRKRTPAEYEETLYSNLDDLRRMARMIDDMLFLAKADNGLIVPQRQRVALQALVAKLLDYYQLLAEDRGIALRLEGRGEVMGDALMLDRAISNLISNALRYTTAGETVRVSIAPRGQEVCLQVRNPGPAIPRAQWARIFDRFHRADPARREGSPNNAGLGLAITRSIVEAHHGQIGCRSEDGLTTFEVCFPAV